LYFHRAVHDALRAIAYEERKTISDLVNEGIDHVLTSRKYPTAEALREQGREGARETLAAIRARRTRSAV
jgi:hypothetical protein